MKPEETASLVIIAVIGIVFPIFLSHAGMVRAAYAFIAVAGGWSCYILLDKLRDIRTQWLMSPD